MLTVLFHAETDSSHVADGVLGEQLVALDVWLDARTPEDVTETQWSAAVNTVSQLPV